MKLGTRLAGMKFPHLDCSSWAGPGNRAGKAMKLQEVPCVNDLINIVTAEKLHVYSVYEQNRKRQK